MVAVATGKKAFRGYSHKIQLPPPKMRPAPLVACLALDGMLAELLRRVTVRHLAADAGFDPPHNHRHHSCASITDWVRGSPVQCSV
jgi:hypothetical protein